MDAITCHSPNRAARVSWSLNAPWAQTVTFLHTVDASAIEGLRRDCLRRGGCKPTYTAILAKAISLALREHPAANRAILGLPGVRRFVQFRDIHASIAVEQDVPGAEGIAFVGTVFDSDRKTVLEIAEELRAMTEADPATHPRLRLWNSLISRLPTFLSRWIIRMPCYFPSLWPKHRGGPFLISSPAKYGVDMVVASWPWPLGFSFGLVKDRPVVEDGRVVARRTLPLTMNFDRRIMAGAPAARFFRRIVELLETADMAMASPPESKSAQELVH